MYLVLPLSQTPFSSLGSEEHFSAVVVGNCLFLMLLQWPQEMPSSMSSSPALTFPVKSKVTQGTHLPTQSPLGRQLSPSCRPSHPEQRLCNLAPPPQQGCSSSHEAEGSRAMRILPTDASPEIAQPRLPFLSPTVGPVLDESLFRCQLFFLENMKKVSGRGVS